MQTRQSGSYAAALLRYATDIITVVDADGVVRYVNAAPGVDTRRSAGSDAMSHVHPDDHAYAAERRRWLLEEPGRTGTTTMRVRSESGWRHVETTGINLLHDPEVEGLLYLTRDVEERVQERAELERAVAGQRLVADLALRALTHLDLVGLLDDAISKLAALLDAQEVSVAGLPGGPRTAGPEHGEGTSSLSVPLSAGRHRLGTLTARRTQPFGPGDVELLHNVAEVLAGALLRAEHEQRAVLRALHDPLTGLASRALLEERLRAVLARVDEPCAVLLVDLDRFKQVNDTFGHAAGDDVLRQLSPRLLRCVRPTDTVARYGGDEFVVLCEDVSDRSVVQQIAARVERACALPFRLSDGQRVLLSGSVGVAWRTASSTAEQVLAEADAEMYRRKRAQ